MKTLYVVPFMGIGRRITLDIDFRYRGDPGGSFDRKIIQYDRVWCKTPTGNFVPEQINKWASVMLAELEKAHAEGYTLQQSGYSHIGALIHDLKSVQWLVDVGFGEREAAVSSFLLLLHKCNLNDF